MRAAIAKVLFWFAWSLRPTPESKGLDVALRLRRFGLPFAILAALAEPHPACEARLAR